MGREHQAQLGFPRITGTRDINGSIEIHLEGNLISHSPSNRLCHIYEPVRSRQSKNLWLCKMNGGKGIIEKLHITLRKFLDEINFMIG
jgi:hypothetical protein